MDKDAVKYADKAVATAPDDHDLDTVRHNAMTEFARLRDSLRLSAEACARELGVLSGRTVRRWETGARDVPGPVIRLMRLWTDPRLPPDLKPRVKRQKGESGHGE